MPCDLVFGYRNLRGSCCVHLTGRGEEEIVWDKNDVAIKKGGTVQRL